MGWVRGKLGDLVLFSFIIWSKTYRWSHVTKFSPLRGYRHCFLTRRIRLVLRGFEPLLRVVSSRRGAQGKHPSPGCTPFPFSGTIAESRFLGLSSGEPGR